MKNLVFAILFCISMPLVTGCAPSDQEKLVQQQAIALKQQQAMLASFQAAAEKAQVQAKLHAGEKAQTINWGSALKLNNVHKMAVK